MAGLSDDEDDDFEPKPPSKAPPVLKKKAPPAAKSPAQDHKRIQLPYVMFSWEEPIGDGSITRTRLTIIVHLVSGAFRDKNGGVLDSRILGGQKTLISFDWTHCKMLTTKFNDTLTDPIDGTPYHPKHTKNVFHAKEVENMKLKNAWTKLKSFMMIDLPFKCENDFTDASGYAEWQVLRMNTLNLQNPQFFLHMELMKRQDDYGQDKEATQFDNHLADDSDDE